VIARETQSLVEDTVQEILARCVTQDDEHGFALDCRQLSNARGLVIRDLFITLWSRRRWPQRDMGFERWNELAELARAPADAEPSATFPGGIRACRQGQLLRVYKPFSPSPTVGRDGEGGR
jgi:hypothetical protein